MFAFCQALACDHYGSSSSNKPVKERLPARMGMCACVPVLLADTHAPSQNMWQTAVTVPPAYLNWRCHMLCFSSPQPQSDKRARTTTQPIMPTSSCLPLIHHPCDIIQLSHTKYNSVLQNLAFKLDMQVLWSHYKVYFNLDKLGLALQCVTLGCLVSL